MFAKPCLASDRHPDSDRHPELGRRPTADRERGLTLIEVVVATAIFSVTVVSLLIVRSRAIEHTATSKNLRIAKRLTLRLLEEIHAGKEYENGQEGYFDEVKYPGFGFRVKEVQEIEIEDSEEEDKLGRSSGSEEGPGGKNPGKNQPGGPGANPFAAALAAGGGDPIKRYTLDIAYPASTPEGIRTFEIIAYQTKEPDPKALMKALGSGLGGAAGGAEGPGAANNPLSGLVGGRR